MKTKLLFILCALLLGGVCFGQTDTKDAEQVAAPNYSDLTEPKATGKPDPMKESYINAEKNENELDTIGKLVLKSITVKIYDKDRDKEKEVEEFKINSVKVVFRSQRLQTLIVYGTTNAGKDSKYFYLTSPRNIVTDNNINFLFTDGELIQGDNKKRYIKIGDILSIEPRDPRRFRAGDTNIPYVLDEDHRIAHILGDKVFPVNGVAYTDFEGLSDNKPNGLLQSEIYVPLHLIRRAISNGRGASFYLLYNVMPEISISKIDQKLKYLPVGMTTLVNTSQDIKYLHTFGLWQYSNLRIGGKLNLFMIDIHDINSRFYGDYQFYAVRTAVSEEYYKPESKTDTLRNSVLTMAHGFSFNFTINHSGRFRVDFQFQLLYLNLVSQDYEQSRGKYFSNNDQLVNSQTFVSITKPREKWLYAPQIQFSLKPDLNKDHFLYARAILYNNDHVQNNFLQLQVGVTANLRTLFSK